MTTVGMILESVRFFRVVSPTSRLMRRTFVVLTVLGGITSAVAPDRATAALLPILVLQLFATSAGFSIPGRRGYYDLLLTRGRSRLIVAGAQWVMSASPGVASWCVLSVGAALTNLGATPAGFTSGSVVALALVSTVPWAVNVSLPRFSSAVGWLLIVAIGHAILPELSPFAAPAGGPGVVAALRVVGVMLCPIVLIGTDVASRSGVAVPAGIVMVATMGSALMRIRRQDLPLETAQ